ncbi:MAG TPA: hypothetical protein VKX17_25825 [Planctomycetota bacterium]|nr:hypothetical protein [Planctomycetota bacterium]
MRVLIALAGFCFLASTTLFAADTISPEEKKLQEEFTKAYRVNDKDARKTAVGMLDGAKHKSSWDMVANVARTDPDKEVQLAAIGILAKVPAHDGSIAHQLALIYSAIKFNDIEHRLAVAKILTGVEFKYEIANAIGYQLTQMRYPDVPKPMAFQTGGNNLKQIEAVQKQRKEYEELLEDFNTMAHSEVTPIKEAPNKVKQWLAENSGKLVQADRELADKYKKEDAEAAKAAKAAAGGK